MHLSLPIAALLATTACLAPKPLPGAASTEAAFGPVQTQVPSSELDSEAWRALSLVGFETWLEKVPEAGPQRALQLAELGALAASDAEPNLALRAALILIALDQEAAAAELMTQLEARHEHPERFADAADVAAAAGLSQSRFAAPLKLTARLAALATGPAPHPDLEVRTECARSALELGQDEVADLLLRITRLGTQLGRRRDGDWHSPITTTWSRDRAAQTLAEALGLANPYRGDASLAARETAALALEAAWLKTHK